jgi:ribosomal protein S27E
MNTSKPLKASVRLVIEAKCPDCGEAENFYFSDCPMLWNCANCGTEYEASSEGIAI